MNGEREKLVGLKEKEEVVRKGEGVDSPVWMEGEY